MNTAELLAVRRDLVKMVASLQPELQAEIVKMEQLTAESQAAAKIIGTQEQVDALKDIAEQLVKNAKAEADIILAEASVIKGDATIAQAQVSASQKLLDEAWDQLKSEKALQQEAVSIHIQNVHRYDKMHNSRMQELDTKATGLGEWEAKLQAKENEMLQRVAKMKEALA